MLRKDATLRSSLVNLERRHLLGILGVLRQLDSGSENAADFRFKGYTNDFMIAPRTHVPSDPFFGTSSAQQPQANSDTLRFQDGGKRGAEPRSKADWIDDMRNGRQPIDRSQEDDAAAEVLSANLRKFRQEQMRAEQDIQRFKDGLSREIPLARAAPQESPDGRGGGERRAADASLGSSMQSLDSSHRDAIEDARGESPRDAYDAPGRADGRRDPALAAEPARDKRAKSENPAGTGLVLHKSLGGGGGEPQHTPSGRIRTRFPITMRRDNYGHSIMAESPTLLASGRDSFSEHSKQSQSQTTGSDAGAYFPFGRPGAGAPLRNQDGTVASQIRGKMLFNDSADVQKRQRAANAYLAELKQEMEHQEQLKSLRTKEEQEKADGFAAIIEHGRVGHPRRDPETGLLSDQHNPASDVTKLKVGLSPSPAGNPRVYHDDLTALAKERHRLRELDRMRELHEDANHEMHWSELWGRPGGGAPNAAPTYHQDHKRANLDRMLYHTDGRDASSQGYVKNTLGGIRELSPAHFQKNYVHSNHANNYQLNGSGAGPSRHAYAKRPHYEIKAPFATDARALQPY